MLVESFLKEFNVDAVTISDAKLQKQYFLIEMHR